LLVAPTAANRDALHGRTRQIVAPVESLAVAGDRIADESYARAWREAEAAARGALDAALEAEGAMFEGKAAWLLAKHLPAGTPVCVANSMPVRDVEYFWPANGRGQEFFFNRGANGIDGTLSTALGVAHGGKPAVLLTGDLALLHDANGFLLRPKLRGSLTVVLINNNGGGIFEHLPVAQFEPPFEEFFATPQEVDFGKLCAAHGVEHKVVRDWAHFTELVLALPEKGIRVLEVRTDRKRDAAQRKKLFATIAQAAAVTRVQ
jgi:2-succinyl-5-enolpyruvyl-6-hydroxy-3-cyclohexene-1-carboxylate synthase